MLRVAEYGTWYELAVLHKRVLVNHDGKVVEYECVFYSYEKVSAA